MAVARLKSCDNIVALSEELGVHRPRLLSGLPYLINLGGDRCCQFLLMVDVAINDEHLLNLWRKDVRYARPRNSRATCAWNMIESTKTASGSISHEIPTVLDLLLAKDNGAK